MTDNLRDNVSKLLYEMCGIKGEINFITLKLVIYRRNATVYHDNASAHSAFS